MSKSNIVACVAALALLIVLFALISLIYIPSDTLRHQVEEQLAHALGMEVSVGAPVVFVLPMLHATLKDVQVRNDSLEVATVAKATIGIRLFPLLRGHVSIDSIALHDVGIFLARDHKGRFNVQNDRQKKKSQDVVQITWVTITNARLHFESQEPWQSFRATACNLDLRNLYLPNAKQTNYTEGLAFSGELRCDAFESASLTLSDLAFSLNANAEALTLEPIKLRMFDTYATGQVAVDLSGPVPQWNMQLSLPGFPIEAFLRTLSPNKVAAGSMDFSMRVAMQGATLAELTQTMAGQVSLRGSDLTLDGIDLDEELAQLDSSRNFNLVDVGAFFLAGPVGLIATRGYQFTSLLIGSDGTSKISYLVSDWQIEAGIMRAKDVAMATTRNRVALQGALDFVDQDFDDVIVALLNSNGCVEAQQKVEGTFANPVVAHAGVLLSIARPALELVKQGKDLLSGDECEVFYTGSVATPTLPN